jgi:predicted branched-subunit amino acid permease
MTSTPVVTATMLMSKRRNIMGLDTMSASESINVKENTLLLLYLADYLHSMYQQGSTGECVCTVGRSVT